MTKLKDFSEFIGKKYNRWTIIEFVVQYRYGKNMQLAYCQCECGSKKILYLSSIVKNKSLKCGCLKSKLSKKRKTYFIFNLFI